MQTIGTRLLDESGFEPNMQRSVVCLPCNTRILTFVDQAWLSHSPVGFLKLFHIPGMVDVIVTDRGVAFYQILFGTSYNSHGRVGASEHMQLIPKILTGQSSTFTHSGASLRDLV